MELKLGMLFGVAHKCDILSFISFHSDICILSSLKISEFVYLEMKLSFCDHCVMVSVWSSSVVIFSWN